MKMWHSRTLWLAGLTVMSLGPLGCVVEDADDSAFVFEWQVAYVDRVAVSCANAGTPFVQLDARNLHTGAIYPTKPSCELGRARTDVLPLGQYEVTLSLLDAQGRPVSQITDGPFEIGRYDLTFLQPIEFRVQAIDIAWRLLPAGGSGFVTCGQVGARTVELLTQLGTENPETLDTFPCEAGGGVTPAIRVGNYRYQARLLDNAGRPLSETTMLPLQVGGDQLSALDVDFTVR
jgi:hypothetical protein